jgi:hypothetical protein
VLVACRLAGLSALETHYASDDTHRRYWRDQRGNPNAEIPVWGGDVIERGGKRYAVLYDVDRKPVAVYEVVERLFAVKDAAVVEALTTQVEEVEEPPVYRARLRRRRW